MRKSKMDLFNEVRRVLKQHSTEELILDAAMGAVFFMVLIFAPLAMSGW